MSVNKVAVQFKTFKIFGLIPITAPPSARGRHELPLLLLLLTIYCCWWCSCLWISSIRTTWQVVGMMHCINTEHLSSIIFNRRLQLFLLFQHSGLAGAADLCASGELAITYLDDEMRISRGDKGNLFVLLMDDPDARP